MKNISAAWATLAILLLFSCSKKEDEIAEIVYSIKIAKNTVNINFEPQTETFSIESSDKWTTKDTPEWCSLQPASGEKGTTQVTLSITENLSGKQRIGVILFKTGNKTQRLVVEQSMQLTMNLPRTKYAFATEGGVAAIVSEKNMLIQSKNDNGWLSYEEKNGTLKLTATKNETDDTRIAVVVFKDKNSTETHEVLIIQYSAGSKSSLYKLNSIKIDDIPCIMDVQTREVFFPVDMDTPVSTAHKIEFEGLGVDYLQLNNNGTKIYSGETINIADFKAGKSMTLTTFNATSGEFLHQSLNITGLPIVSITAPQGIVDEPKRPCSMIIIDPKGRTNDNQVYTEMYAGIEFRGSGALRYDKKAFGFKTTSDKEATQSTDASFLNLRKDNNWILDAMWLDNAKMRNRVCFDIWNDFNQLYYKTSEPKANSGTHGDLVEVFLDGKYHGMYVLSDKLDRKQLQIKKDGGYLYKNGDWTDECILQGYTSPYDNNSLVWNGVESDYPDEIGLVEYKYYHDLLQFVSKSSKDDFSTKFEEYIDMDNMVDYFIYTNLIVAFDNLGRNTFWGLYNNKKSTKMFPLMWDLDGTLGRTWDAQTEDPNMGWLVHNRHNGKAYKIFERIINENPADIKSKIKARWNDMKDKALSTENLNKKVDYYAQQQIKSGAAAREIRRWDTGYKNAEAEATYIKSWYGRRWTKMNQLINNL